MNRPKDWSEVTLKQYSRYNKVVSEYHKKIENLNPEKQNEASIILLEELKFQHDVCEVFSGLTAKTIDKKSISEIKEYCSGLDFLKKSPEYLNKKEFTFKGVKYIIPEDVRMETKYGQYVEAMQSQMAWEAKDKDSIMYLAHQLAHQVSGEWIQEDRDKLAIEFEDLTMDVFFDFSFFLQKKSIIYIAAYQKLLIDQAQKKKTMKNRLWDGLDTLKRYTKLLKGGFLKDLIKLRLTVYYILIRQKFLTTWGTWFQKLTMNT